MAEQEQTRTTSETYVQPGAGNAWAADAAARGQSGTQRLLAASVVAAPSDVSIALELGRDDRVVLRSRLMYLDGRPVELADSYYPLDVAAGTPLAEAGKIRGGAVAVLAASGHAPAEVFEQVTARRPNAAEAELLQVEQGESLLVLTRTNRDSAGRAVEFAVNRMVARLNGPITYRLRIAPT